jgi:hypothetical protein
MNRIKRSAVESYTRHAFRGSVIPWFCGSVVPWFEGIVMRTPFLPLPSRTLAHLPWRRILEVGLLIVMIGLLQLIEPLSRLWVRDVISQNAVDQQLSIYADEIVIQALMGRRFEKDILLNLDNPEERDRYITRWNRAVADLEVSIDSFQTTALTPGDQAQAEQWREYTVAYRLAMQQMLQTIDAGTVMTPAEANAMLDPGKQPIRALTNSALATAEKKEGATLASSEELRGNLATGARIIVLVLLAGVLFSAFRPRA